MSHILHTISRSGCYYYNRRVPKHAVKAYGNFIRIALSRCPQESEEYAKRLSYVLEGSWRDTTEIRPVDIISIVESYKPRITKLSEIAEYLALRPIDQTPPRVALSAFILIAGDRDVSEYTREDAKLSVRHLTLKGNKTATIRGRINSLSAILNYAYAGLDLDKRNPFSRLIIQNEGGDTSKRETFTHQQLKQGYEHAIASGCQIKLLMPLLGETGCRLAKIVRLKLKDIDLEQGLIHIRPNAVRRLKTRNSKRTLPLVGYARKAMELALKSAEDTNLFPRYIKRGSCQATHASNALKSWLKNDFSLTGHSLRHTFRDRLRAVETPLELIDQIGGWRSITTVGAGSGKGYGIDKLTDWIKKAQT
jgi:integrase